MQRCANANTSFGAEVLALVPVATNTKHWKKYIWGQATAVCFLYDTRLRFLVKGKDEGKGRPCLRMVYWGNNFKRFQDVFLEFGAVVDLRPLRGKRIGRSEQFSQKALIDDE